MPPVKTGLLVHRIDDLFFFSSVLYKISLLARQRHLSASHFLSMMKPVFVILVASLLVTVDSLPGGYTANGGIFNPYKELDYLDEARRAGTGKTLLMPLPPLC